MTTRNTTMSCLIAAATLFGGIGAVQAQEAQIMTLPDTEFGKYAGFAKLESNLAEITAGSLVGRLLDDESAASAMDIDDPAEDIAAAEAYVGALEGMSLTDAERTALDEFKAGWGELLQLREQMTEGEDLPTETLSAYWKQVNDLDELVDDVLTSILDEEPAIN